MGITVYVSSQCPNCDRLVKTLRRLKLKATLVNIDQTPVNGLTAVPTVVDGRQTMVGTKAFEWLQSYESEMPLEEYATVLGEGCGGLSYTDLESGDTVNSTLFTPF
jgi:glutaredoxin